MTNTDRITTIEGLEAHYGQVNPRAIDKEQDHLTDHYRALVEASPFVLVATVGPEGLDCSPRGDPPGFVRIQDKHTVLMPDRRGNNRLDTLKNIVRDPRTSLLFMIPGVGETLRVNGKAEIVTEPELCASFAMQEKNPKSVIVTTIDTVYFQCQKALARSKLWAPESIVERATLPTAGQMAEAMSKEPFDGKTYDENYPEHMKKTIY